LLTTAVDAWHTSRGIGCRMVGMVLVAAVAAEVAEVPEPRWAVGMTRVGRDSLAVRVRHPGRRTRHGDSTDRMRSVAIPRRTQ